MQRNINFLWPAAAEAQTFRRRARHQLVAAFLIRSLSPSLLGSICRSKAEWGSLGQDM
jgi:hypothetical protein